MPTYGRGARNEALIYTKVLAVGRWWMLRARAREEEGTARTVHLAVRRKNARAVLVRATDTRVHVCARYVRVCMRRFMYHDASRRVRTAEAPDATRARRLYLFVL